MILAARPPDLQPDLQPFADGDGLDLVVPRQHGRDPDLLSNQQQRC